MVMLEKLSEAFVVRQHCISARNIVVLLLSMDELIRSCCSGHKMRKKILELSSPLDRSVTQIIFL